ncbi:phage holin family protein [Rubricoccus marinus]|uniref:Phage holin family protein n=1 Tax=Rubricoccus marinus TaxID=716817 RepID=A0A259TY38_9BACT|nr:phage holin family protein [Rubricoccus marinus]OZC02683.1 hypothetical protein BSZ36_06660 [Rubricoccus marinus]
MPTAPPRGRNLPARRTIPPVLDPAATPVPESHQLAPHQTKIERIGDHVAALSADLREYVELRIALVQRKVEGVIGIVERLQHYADAAKFFVPAVVLALVGALFVLLTIAFGIGALLDSVWLGFLITTLVLLAVAGVLAWMGMRKVKEAQAKVVEAKRKQQDERNITREQVQDTERLKARQSVV